MTDIKKILEKFDKEFGFYEIYICADCGHTKEDHYWNGGGHVEYGGYDMCKADNCKCVSENWKIEKKKEENKALKDFLATSIQQAVAEAEKKLLRTLLTECDRTENEGGRLLLTNYKLQVKK